MANTNLTEIFKFLEKYSFWALLLGFIVAHRLLDFVAQQYSKDWQVIAPLAIVVVCTGVASAIKGAQFLIQTLNKVFAYVRGRYQKFILMKKLRALSEEDKKFLEKAVLCKIREVYFEYNNVNHSNIRKNLGQLGLFDPMYMGAPFWADRNSSVNCCFPFLHGVHIQTCLLNEASFDLLVSNARELFNLKTET